MITPHPRLASLRQHFLHRGYDLWFVGGCVRDSILGQNPKDIDLCTDARPDEAIEIYNDYNIRYFETGIDHGTITVLLDEPYEITSLRTESEHDGRHAVVAYTRDLREDLSRRDLTINAMAQQFDGTIIDPFGGGIDLATRCVRFVGDAEERMKEDYLRILRFFRFHARFGGITELDKQAVKAIKATHQSLGKISGERMWMEMSKIVAGPHAAVTMSRMKRLHVLPSIGCFGYDTVTHGIAEMRGVTSAPTIFGLSMGRPNLDKMISRWKVSNIERAEMRFANSHRKNPHRPHYKELLVDGAERAWVENMLMYHGIGTLSEWETPIFPVGGHDIMKLGTVEGRGVGDALKKLKAYWKANEYKLSKDDLLAKIA